MCLAAIGNLTWRFYSNHSFTWLNSRREPVEMPAYENITLMQRWIGGKINDTKIFPTEASEVSFALNPNFTATSLSQLSSPGERDWVGKRSGFPENFFDVCQTIFRQMFRVYAHLYWAHFVERTANPPPPLFLAHDHDHNDELTRYRTSI